MRGLLARAAAMFRVKAVRLTIEPGPQAGDGGSHSHSFIAAVACTAALGFSTVTKNERHSAVFRQETENRS
jgi:hypothetical protein